MEKTGLKYTRKISNPARFEFTESGCLVVVNRKLNADGYYRRRTDRGRKLIMHHRAVWEELNGTIPKGMEVNHRCRNRACCNPEHLEILDISYHKTITNLSRDFKLGNWMKQHARKDFT